MTGNSDDAANETTGTSEQMSSPELKPLKTADERRREFFEGPIGRSEINKLPKAERLKKLNEMRSNHDLPWETQRDRIPSRVMERVKLYLADIEGGAEEGEASITAGVSIHTVRAWRRRYPRFVLYEQRAIAERTERRKAIVSREWEARAITGKERVIRRVKDADGNVVKEVTAVERSDSLLSKMIDVLWPEYKTPAVSVTTNVNVEQERSDAIAILSNPELRAALERAVHQQSLPAPEPGDAGGSPDEPPPA